MTVKIIHVSTFDVPSFYLPYSLLNSSNENGAILTSRCDREGVLLIQLETLAFIAPRVVA